MMKNDLDMKTRNAFEAISSANKTAYRDIFLMSNEVLSKNPYHNKFLERFIRGDEVPSSLPGVIALKIAAYYFKSMGHFVLYLLRFLEFRISLFRFQAAKPDKNELVVIDTVFNMEKIKSDRKFSELFLPGLEEELRKRGKPYAYLPYFYSAAYSKKPFELFRVLRILKQDKIPVITEYQLLSFGDLAKILWFIAVYPLRILRFAGSLKSDKAYGSQLLRYEVLDTINTVTFYNHSRYLLGRRIAQGLPYERIKVISWYENRPIHKNLYKGLRSNVSRVKIYGAQLFLYPRDYLTLLPDENEKIFGIVPDKILTNGSYFIPPSTRLNYSVGPSLRYSWLFRPGKADSDRRYALVLLPFMMHQIRSILAMIKEVDTVIDRILVKAHPGVPVDAIRGLMPLRAEIAEGDMRDLFQGARIVIGAESGSLVEAASMGIPAILIKDKKQFGCHNPFPEYGQGIIWDEANSPEELIEQIGRLEKKYQTMPETVRKVADEYKKTLFCEPTEESIITAFEI